MSNLKKLKQGDKIVFKGYDENTKEEDRYLTEGETYTIADIDQKEKRVSVEIDNPGFNPKKKETDDNPKVMLIDVFEEEFDLPEEEAPAEEEVAPAKVTRAKPAAAAKGKPAAAKPGVNKTTAKPAAETNGKGKGKKAAAPEPEVEEDEDAMEALESEDEEVLEMVQEAEKSKEGLIGLAKELAEKAAAQDYQLGGILYHVRLTKAHRDLDDRYKERGGFGLFVREQLNVEYRKAMELIRIYFTANKFGISAEKIAAMGWTKASKIVGVMDEENAEELVQLAEEHSVSELVDNIKANYVEKGGTKGDKKKRLVFKFALFEDSAEVVKAALEGCAAAMGYKKLDEAFEHIVTEWATEHPMKPAAKAVEGRKVSAPAKKTTAPAARPAPRAAARPAAR